MEESLGPPGLVETFTALAASDNVSYILSNDLFIQNTNSAWDQFAIENGGEQILATWGRGASLLAAIPEPLRPFFVDGFARACSTGERWEHDYECSSPERYRQFRMIVFPFAEGFVVTHALRAEHAHDRETRGPAEAYVHQGLITMCAHCRRVRTPPRARERWDWVPVYVARPQSRVSHGLCPPCAEYYYPDVA